MSFTLERKVEVSALIDTTTAGVVRVTLKQNMVFLPTVAVLPGEAREIARAILALTDQLEKANEVIVS